MELAYFIKMKKLLSFSIFGELFLTTPASAAVSKLQNIINYNIF